MADKAQTRAYVPPKLPAGQRRLLDALAGREAAFTVDIGGTPWRIEPQPLSGRPAGLPVLAAKAGESVWRVTLAATQELYEALGIPEDVDRESMPEAVLWGIAEARLEGALKALEALTGQAAAVVAPDEGGGDSFCLEFSMAAEGGRALRGWVHVPLDEETVHTLENVLARRPRAGVEVADMPVELGVEAGRMTLTMAELRTVEPGDVLLPQEWHPASGCVYLSAPPLRVCVPWPDTGGGPWSIVKESEADMSEEKKEIPEAADAPEAPEAAEAAQAEPVVPKGGLAGVEVDVVFEIGRLRMSVRELETLGQGQTLPLPESLGPQVAVSVMGNGRKLASGRIVNVGETLGVQITGLEGR